jgi:hypothetical protein
MPAAPSKRRTAETPVAIMVIRPVQSPATQIGILASLNVQK